MVVILGATGSGKTTVPWRGGNQVGSGPCLVEDVCHSLMMKRWQILQT